VGPTAISRSAATGSSKLQSPKVSTTCDIDKSMGSIKTGQRPYTPTADRMQSQSPSPLREKHAKGPIVIIITIIIIITTTTTIATFPPCPHRVKAPVLEPQALRIHHPELHPVPPRRKKLPFDLPDHGVTVVDDGQLTVLRKVNR
jgi:hypothetical protein